MATSGSELVLIRHAPTDAHGRLCGRTDVPARPDCLADLDRLRRALGPIRRHVASPALRCLQTAEALWPGARVATDERLSEQDFGDWDGLPFDQVPDLGTLPAAELARHRPPGGESFTDLCDRAGSALVELACQHGSIAVVAHAGTVRAGLALALRDPGLSLSFEVAPLSVTRLRIVPDGFSIVCVNRLAE